MASVLTIAGLALWFVLHATLLSALQEQSDQSRLYGELRSQLAAATTPIAAPIREGTPVALIDAPRGGIHRQVVVEGTTSVDLTHGPGHLPSTPLPGQAGVSVLMGRSLLFGGPFGSITAMKRGDRIIVVTGQDTFTYRVDRVRRPGDTLPSVPASGASRLTLITSGGGGWAGLAPSSAVYVDATLVGSKAQDVPAALPSVGPSFLPMRGYTGDLTELVFWLQGLVLAAVAVAWAHIRWGRWQSWVTGVPVVVALLWGATSTAELLLPNLI